MSNDVVIRVENLSKRYRIGLKEELHDTLGGALISWLKSPFTNLRNLRKLTTFNDLPREIHNNGSEADFTGDNKATNNRNRITNNKYPDNRQPITDNKYTNNPSRSDVIWALKDVSFEVKHGEVIGIIGRNGAGKSTLLKILSRITEPTSGRAVIQGRVSSLLEVGTGFHPELTGRENIYLNGTVLGMSKTEVDRKFDEIVAFAEVEKFIDTPVKRYSSGMNVRLAFAVAAHLEPEILLVDEVLAVGDVGFQKKCLGKMGEVAGGGRTVLFVSHNMGMIRSLCDRSILLVNGSIAKDDKSGDVVSAYLATWSPASENKGEICWRHDEQAPNCEEMRLCSIRLLDSAGKVKYTFDVDELISIEITYQVHTRLRGMRTVLQLFTEKGDNAFTSTDYNYLPDSVDPGLHRSLATIPSGLLNRQKYIVNVSFGIPGIKKLIPTQDYLSFDCIKGKIEGHYTSDRWPGALAPQLEWSFERLD